MDFALVRGDFSVQWLICELTSLVTVLIAYRVWQRQRAMRDSRAAFSLTREAAIMAESGKMIHRMTYIHGL